MDGGAVGGRLAAEIWTSLSFWVLGGGGGGGRWCGSRSGGGPGGGKRRCARRGGGGGAAFRGAASSLGVAGGGDLSRGAGAGVLLIALGMKRDWAKNTKILRRKDNSRNLAPNRLRMVTTTTTMSMLLLMMTMIMLMMIGLMSMRP